MEEYNELDTFERVGSRPIKVESLPTIEEIERRLRKLGCTKKQVRRHLDQARVLNKIDEHLWMVLRAEPAARAFRVAKDV